MPEMVTCAACGFLAVMRRRERTFVEGEEKLRSEGYLYVDKDMPGAITCDPWLVCFMRAADLKKEMGQPEPGAKPGDNRRLEVLHRERQCGSFTPWQQGFSPKEHAEMQLLEQQREFQREESEAARIWQAEQAKIAEERHQESLRVAMTTSKENTSSNIIAGVIGAMATLLAVLVGSWMAKPSTAPPVNQTVNPPAAVTHESKSRQLPAPVGPVLP